MGNILTHQKMKMRGQWYIIAAVLFSFSLLTLFNIFISYSRVDFTSVLENNEDIIFLNLVRELNKTIENSAGRENLEADISDFFNLVENNLLGKGYFFDYNYSVGEIVDITKLEIAGKNMMVKYRVPIYRLLLHFDEGFGNIVHDDSGYGNDGTLINSFHRSWEDYDIGARPEGWYIEDYGGCDGNCSFDFYITNENYKVGLKSFRYFLNPNSKGGGWQATPIVRKNLTNNIPVTKNTRLHWYQYDREHSLHVCLLVRNNNNELKELCYLANAPNHWANLCDGNGNVNMSDASGKIYDDCYWCYNAWHWYERNIYKDYQDEYCDGSYPTKVEAIKFKHFFHGTWEGNKGADIDDFWINDVNPWTAGKIGFALQFDGSNDYVEITDSDSLDMSNEITIEAWVKIKNITGTWQAILRKEIGGDRNYGFYVHPTTGKLHFSFKTVETGSLWGPVEGYNICDNQWHYIAVTYNKNYNSTHGCAIFYIDEDSFIVCNDQHYTMTISGAKVHIGDQGLNGIIDEIKVYNRALTEYEIRAHFESSS